MKHTIQSIILLAAILIGGAGQAGANSEPELGKIVYTESANDHGSLAFYEEEACTTPINTTIDGFVYSDGLTSVKDGSGETVIGYKVYIQATPDFGYTLEAGDETTGKVSFITAEVTVAGTDVAGARTRGTAPTVGVGDFIDVTATETEGVYCVTMPADKNLNLHITATFPERPYLTGVSYIDPTKTGNAQNATTPAGTKVYILTGTETVLGSDDDTPTWYVVNGDVNFNHAFEINNDVCIILANEKTMNVGSETSGLESYGIAIRSGSQLTIYGQGGATEGSLNIYSNESSPSIYSTTSNTTITICGGNVVTSHNINFANGTVKILGGTFTDEEAFSESAIPYSIQASEIMIDGGAVSAKGLLFAETNGITVNGGSVDVYQLVADKGNITLGWKNAETDYIKTTNGYQCNDNDGNLTFATGKRFYAYDGENVAAVYDAQTVLTKDETYKTYPDLAGKALKPCTDIFVKLIDGVTASATGGESITIGTDTWYKVASGTEVTLTATDGDNKKLSSVTLSDGTISVANNGNNTFTFTMGESDVTVTAATFLEKVSYFDPTAEGDNKTKTVFATPLTGNETTLAAGWYVVNKDVDYTTVKNGYVLNATGDVNLILADGKTMNIGSEENPVTGRGIYFSSSAALAIYGQGGTTEGSLKIYTGTTYSIQGKVDITIYGGNLTVGSTLSTDGKFTIHGGTFTDARTTNDNNATNITAIYAAEINIRGGRVTSVGKLYGNQMGTGDINISGGIVDVYSLSAYNGSIAISGGQVTLRIAKNHAIHDKNGITLGWTNVTDYISVTSEGQFHSDGDLTISEGKGFLAISGDNTRAYYDRNSTITKDNYGNFSVLTGKTLRPALKITLPEGVTATGTDVVTHETAGTYAIYGAKVTLSGTATAGYTFSFTVKDASNNDVTVEGNGFTMPATDVTVTATQTAISATAPTISTQPSGLSLFYGYNSDNVLSISASAAEGHTLSYQWYSNSSNSTSGGTAINEATESSYTVPAGMSVGTTYYYCVVTATRSDNSQTATTTTNVATVTVSKVPTEINVYEATIELEVNDEISTGATLTPAEAGNLAYTSSNTSVAEVEEGKIIALGVGTATITVSFAGDDTYDAAESKTIEVTVSPITLTLNEGTGNAGVIDIPGGGSSMEVNLTYNRTLTAPTESNKDVTIGGQAVKLYTTCLPTAPATGDNVKYYILSGVSGKTLNFSEVTSPVADTPYLMAVTGSSNATESVTDQDVTLLQKVTGANADGFTMMGTQTGLSNTDALSASSGNVTYILQDQDKWGKVVNGDVYIPPFRAFIVGPDVSTNGARLLYSSFDGDATGIQNIRTVDADGTEQWYDLNGRRIAKPTTKGVYIRNGKKTTN